MRRVGAVRRLFLENQGGAEHVMMAGITRLHKFPRCPHKSKLSGWLGEWLTLKRQYGGYLPEEYLYIMLLDILPEDVAAEIRDRPSLNTVQRVTDYISGELAR